MKFEDKDLKIVYLDNHILIADKMPNIPTQNNSKIGFEDFLKKYLQKKFCKKNVFLHPVHRIDKVSSGLVLFARTSKALSRLNKSMREKNIKRIYLAVLEGILKKKKGFLENYLEKKNFYTKVSTKGKKALLYYEVLKEKDKNSLVKIELHTGRYHQIRAQFSNIGHPVLGDVKYKSQNKCDVFLNSFFLEFIHPVKKEKISFFSGYFSSHFCDLKKIISSTF